MFQDPEPFGEWTGVRDALQDGNKCKQGILVRNPGADPKNISEVGDEDCLYLCVFTNKVIPIEIRCNILLINKINKTYNTF